MTSTVTSKQSLSEAKEELTSNENPINLPKEYADANKNHIFNINDLKLDTEPTNNYKIYQRIGRGKYSEVFEGKNTTTNKTICIKILKPCLPKLLKIEIYTLQKLKNAPNIIQLLNILQDKQSNLYCLVFELLQCKELKVMLKNSISKQDLCYYMYQCLNGLNFAHSQGIIHRDIKPQNILIDIQRKELKIIDWGLAAFYYPHNAYSVRVCTRAFKAPELLVGHQWYHYAIDMWSFGCMLAGIVFNKQYFFHGKDFPEQMLKIIQVLGMDDFEIFVDKYQIQKPGFMSQEQDKKLLFSNANCERKQFKSFVNNKWNEEKMKFIDDDIIDLIDKLLKYDPLERLSAKEAMEHKYFDSVRNGGNSNEEENSNNEN